MRVQQLVQRLGTPQVALRLQKEELCLALLSVGRLLGSTSEEQMLRQRASQILPTCSSRELAMIATGAPSFGWTQSAFLDAMGGRAHLYVGDMGIDDVSQLLLFYASARWSSYSATAEHLALTSHTSISGKRSDVDAPAIAMLSAAVLVCTNDHFTTSAPLTSSLPFATPLIKGIAADIGRLSDTGVAAALCGTALLLWSGATVDVKILESGCRLLVRRTLEALKKTDTKRHLRLRPSASTRLWAAIVAHTILKDADSSKAILKSIEDDGCLPTGCLSVDPTANAIGCAAFAYLRLKGLLPEELANLPAPLSHPLCVSIVNTLLTTSAVEATPDAKEYLSRVYQLTEGSSTSAGDVSRAALFRAVSAARVPTPPSAAELASLLEGCSRHDIRDVVGEESVGRLLAKWVADGGPAKDDPAVVQRVHAAVQSLPFPDVRAATAPSGDAGGAVQTMSIPSQMVLRREHGETIRDELLMEVLEAVEDYTPTELAKCIYAIPEKCVEFDMLLERVHSGIPELTTDAVSLLLAACIECQQLSEVLLGDLLAQTAETVAGVTTDAHLLIKPLCEALHCSHIEPEQQEDIVTFIEAGSTNFLGVLSRASASTVCAYLAAFKKAPGLLREAFGPCCAHLCSLVPTLGISECAAVMQAVATVDVVHHRLIDTVSIRLKHLLSQPNVSPSDMCAFIDANVALDVPDLDTLLQSSVGALTQPDTLSELRPSLLPAILRGCVYMRHTALTQRCIDALIASVDSLRAVELNDVCTLLSTNSKVDMNGANFSDLATKIVSRCGKLLEDGEGGSLRLSAIFGGIRKALPLTGQAADQVRSKPSIPSYLSDAVAERVDSMTGSEVADILAATVFLSLSGLEGLLQATLSRLAADPASCTTTQLSDAIFAAGESGLVGGHVAHHIAVDSLSDYCVDNEHKWRSGSSIARLVYGFSRVQCTKRSLYNVLATRLRIRPILHTLQQADISVVMSGFGNAKYLDKTLFDRLAKKVEELSPELNAADLTMVLSGYSRMNLLNAPLYQRLGERVAEVSPDLPPQVSARLLAAYGHVGVKHDSMAGSLLTSICSKIDALDANKAVEALFALGEMDHEADDEQMEKLADHIADRIDEVDSNGIFQLCEVLQDLNWRHERLLVAIGTQSAELQLTGNNGGITPYASRNVLDTLGTFMIHHPTARQHLTDAARTLSRDESVVAELEYTKEHGAQALEE